MDAKYMLVKVGGKVCISNTTSDFVLPALKTIFIPIGQAEGELGYLVDDGWQVRFNTSLARFEIFKPGIERIWVPAIDGRKPFADLIDPKMTKFEPFYPPQNRKPRPSQGMFKGKEMCYRQGVWEKRDVYFKDEEEAEAWWQKAKDLPKHVLMTVALAIEAGELQ